MNKYYIALTVVFMIGVGSGLTISYAMNEEEREAKNYCMEVEDGIQDNMDQGFVNCVTPDIIEPEIDERVENKSEVRCVCRRKIRETVNTLQITTSN